MEIIIITGMSGAGKSAALNIFEDMDYYCMDNLPPQLIKNFVDLSVSSNRVVEKLAAVVDIRGGMFFDDLVTAVEGLKRLDVSLSVLFLDADDDVLVRRYKELRRPHPMDRKGNISEGIRKEREVLDEILTISDKKINTSKLNLWDFRKIVVQMYSGDTQGDMVVSLVSFGFKYGILQDADLIFDVRFIPNPFYIAELKEKNGLIPEVRDYVFSFPETTEFIEKTVDLLRFLIPHYVHEGKMSLTVGIGCTGGKHRSSAIAVEIAKRLEAKDNIVVTSHRDDRLW